jgi:hypothetical protein
MPYDWTQSDPEVDKAIIVFLDEKFGGSHFLSKVCTNCEPFYYYHLEGKNHRAFESIGCSCPNRHKDISRRPCLCQPSDHPERPCGKPGHDLMYRLKLKAHFDRQSSR